MVGTLLVWNGPCRLALDGSFLALSCPPGVGITALKHGELMLLE